MRARETSVRGPRLDSAPPRTSRKRIDSGSRTDDASAIAIGMIPPTMKTDGHPKRGMIDAATRPPTAAPSENPQIIVVTAPARRRRGMYSEVSAMAFGMAPPMPSPVIARQNMSDSTDCAVAVSSEPSAENQRAGDEHRLPADAVGERPADECADHHADQTARNHRPEDAARDLQRHRQCRCDVAHRLRVEAVDEHDQPAHHRHKHLVAARRAARR